MKTVYYLLIIKKPFGGMFTFSLVMYFCTCETRGNDVTESDAGISLPLTLYYRHMNLLLFIAMQQEKLILQK